MIRFYYLATVGFLLLDLLFNINVRVAFLDSNPVLRAVFYAILFTCGALILWRPSWAVVIAAVESLVTLVALILGMGVRTMVPGDAPLETGAGLVTIPEIVNFLIAGSIAYYSWQKGLQAFHDKTRIS
jgi:hypothetical protein